MNDSDRITRRDFVRRGTLGAAALVALLADDARAQHDQAEIDAAWGKEAGSIGRL